MPPKDEILNAYAAKYIVGGEEILYFGADRFAQNGTADFGFWFFRGEVGTNADGTFSGVHTIGDILILGTFTQGGAATDIRVFKWVGTGGNATANGTVEGPTGAFADCVPGTANDDGCGTVNDALIEVAWPYQASKGDPGDIPDGGFLEGGVNLSFLNLAGCFRSFLAETRTSASVDSQLKDFVLGNFEACDTTLTTTPGNSATPSVPLTDSNANNIPDASIGTGTVSVKDKATIVVSGAQTWTGTLKFFLCGPIATGECTTGGTQIGPAAGVTVTNATVQPIDSAAAVISSAGRYCWRGEFTSGTTGVPNDSDASAGECFEVLPVTPILDTDAGNGPVDFGQAVTDEATLTGTANKPGTPVINPTVAGLAAGGTITFQLYGPAATSTPTTTECNTLAAGFAAANPNGIQRTVSGDGTYPTATQAAVSFVPQAPGFYFWKATYSGDSPNTNGTSQHNATCNDGDESVEVSQVPTTLTTRQFVFPQDKAKIAVSTGTLAGSITFKLYDTLANCTANTATGLLLTDGPHAIAGASPQFATTNNTTIRVASDATVAWRVTYVSTNTAHLGSSSACVETTAVDFTGDDGTIAIP